MTTRKTHIRKEHRFRKYLSLFLSLIIVFNVTMIPVFAEGEDTAEEPAQEEQTQEESDISEASSEEESDPESSDEEQSADAEQEPEGEEQEPEAEEEEPEEAEKPEEGKPEPHVGGEGKYVKDVYIAYGKTEEEAKAWLRKHKWEPLNGDADFNAGKASAFYKDVAAVMGIRRTDDKNEAITDMAVMNMKGGYSFPDYESLLKEKKADIDEYINSFIPVLKEYRANYNGKGSDAGKERAKIAHELLNKFYDGDKDDPYAANDTEKPLGDLFLDKLMQEGNEKGGDMQQIILESSGPAATMVEVCLALATDDAEETWLERLQGLSGDEISKNLSKYVPEAEGQDVAPSAVKQFLKQHFGDQAKTLAPQWDTIHEKMIWYEEYNDKNDLWKKDGEKDDAYDSRVAEHFEKLDKSADGTIHEDHKKYMSALALYEGLYNISYEGEWGDTLGDFFNPAEGAGYADDTEKFLPFAAALSKGRKAALQHVSLEALLTMGMGTADSIKSLFPDVQTVFKGAETLSIYSGINRGIYRGGVALTSAALMEKNQNGSDPFADMWSFEGIYNITTYATAAVGLVTMGVGFGYLMHIRHTTEYTQNAGYVKLFSDSIDSIKKSTGDVFDAAKLSPEKQIELSSDQDMMGRYKADNLKLTRGARAIMGVGGALIVAAAMAKGYQLYRFYQKTFTQIPTYIVDEADIVSYEKDDEGNETKLIDFDQFVYYGAVKCNRQEVGKIGKWQDGVSDYASWGCGDASDLNSDCGQQWLALYAVKSQRKGDPVLADSLTLQYGSKEMPEGCSRALHMFTYENAADLGDTAYAYNNDKKGVYFFWDVDEGAFKDAGAASTFAGGTAAMAGGVGLLVGIIGTAIVMRKKKEQ